MVSIWVFLQELHEPSISKTLAKATKSAESSQETPPSSEHITVSPKIMEIQSDLHTVFMIYLRTGGLPGGLHHWAGQYTLVNDKPFMRSIIGTLMKCITVFEGCVILQDIHVGICGSHVGV
jgi:hypothetical protein